LHCPTRWPLFWHLRLPRLRRAIIGDLLRRHGGGREEEELQLWGNGGSSSEIQRAKWVYAAHFAGKTKQMKGTTLSVADTAGPLDISRVFVLSRVPDRASASRGCLGLSGWIKGRFPGKTRNRGRG
jgi:hypothetical protein